ncbi:anti-sigma factor family protein [Geodermatophilus sp. SYSU D01062]
MSTVKRMQAGGPPGRNIRCDQLVELVTDYLEGVLDEATMAEFDAHLAQCSGCAEYLDQIRSIARSLARLPLDALSARARARLLAAFDQLHS